MKNLFWVRTIAGSGVPRSYYDIEWLIAHNIQAILSLTIAPLPPDWLRHFRSLHLPITDFTPPTLDQFHAGVDFLNACLTHEETPVVHCGMGYGRTGTMLAAWLISQGVTASDAIKEVRSARPGAIETPAQETSLFDFERDCRLKG